MCEKYYISACIVGFINNITRFSVEIMPKINMYVFALNLILTMQHIIKWCCPNYSQGYYKIYHPNNQIMCVVNYIHNCIPENTKHLETPT